MNIHAHPMFCGLATRTVVGKNERDIHRTFVSIRTKIPLLLGLIMDFVGAGGVTSELRRLSTQEEKNGKNNTDMFWRILGRGK
jgi:hypothetical protein